LKAGPVAAGLFGSLLGFNMAQLGWLMVRPFSPATFRALNRWGADTFWGWCVDWAKLLHGTHIVVSGDDVPPKENVICVANHQQMSDITFMMFLAQDKGRLGDMKWIVKDPIKYVPGVGWGMAFLDCVFVKRNWTADQRTIEATFGRLRDNAVPVWLMSFPEGTRSTPEKLAKSQEYARSQGVEPFEHVLMPRTKGFVASVLGLREHVDAVYDLTIGYDSGVPSLTQYILGYARRAHVHVRRYPIAQLPTARKDIADWLLRRFREKDALLDDFHRDHRFLPHRDGRKRKTDPQRTARR
jgi:1-acyl-sn-glycerol-3-phosphate acyltransferase